MSNFRSGFESGVDEPTRRALLDLDRRIRDGEADGQPGSPGPQGPQGPQGPPGADGQPGADGTTWYVGSGDPAPTLGSTGDYYLDGEAGWVWTKRSNGSWTNLYVNLTGPPGEGAGDHDHDYLPLTGGTVTGDLQVGGKLTVRSGGGAGGPAIAFDGIDGMGIYSSVSGNYMRFGVAGSQRMSIRETYVGIDADLHVDGYAKFIGQVRAHNGTADKPGYSFTNDTSTGIWRHEADAMELVVGGERAIQVGKTGASLDGFWAPGIYRQPTTARYNVNVGSGGGKLGRSTASRSALQQIEPAARAAVHSVLELEPIWYRSACEADDPNLSQYGFAAEDIAAIDPRLATNVEDEDGNLVPDNVDVVAIAALLVGVAKEQRQQIVDLTARIEALEA